MSESFTLSKTALVKLLDGLLYPNPDDPNDPIGPIGPIARYFSNSRYSWAALNPQPLPPVAGPHPDPWRRFIEVMLNPQPLPPAPDPWLRFISVMLNPQPLPPKAGPQPDPWRSAMLARLVIDQAVGQYRAAQFMASEQTERTYEGVRASLYEFVDDFCGSGRPRWPLPFPFPLREEAMQVHPLDMLVAGVQFHKAALATADGTLQADFTAVSDRLLEVGLGQMEG